MSLDAARLGACATRGCDVATNGDTARKNACATKESAWWESWSEVGTAAGKRPLRDWCCRLDRGRSKSRGSQMRDGRATNCELR